MEKEIESSQSYGGISHWHTITPDLALTMRRSRMTPLWRLITTWPYNLIVVVVIHIVAVAVGWPVRNIRFNNDIAEVAPRLGVAYETLQTLNQYTPVFSNSSSAFLGFAGVADDFFVVIEGTCESASCNDASEILQTCGFALTAKIAKEFLALREDVIGFRLQPGAIFAPGFSGGRDVNRSEAISWLSRQGKDAKASNYFSDTVQRCGKSCFVELVPGFSAATVVSIRLPVNPSSADGDRFVIRARSLLRQLQDEGHTGCIGLKVHYFLADAEATVIYHDLMQRVYTEFRSMMPVIMLVVFALISVFLRSAFVPLRLSMTLALPLASVFGLGVNVYQNGWLDWLGLTNLHASADRSFHWEVPIFCFALTIALALDYDLFLVIRIRDFRFAGYTMQGSILRALHETLPIITGAGLMMAVSFGGNFLAESTTLNQAGWILATGVIVDTCLVRILLVPALMSFVDDLNWWPSRPPSMKLMNEFGHTSDTMSEGDVRVYKRSGE